MYIKLRHASFSLSPPLKVSMITSSNLIQVLRRHGDVFERTSNGYYHAHGRADDTMNLGGIKVLSFSFTL